MAPRRKSPKTSTKDTDASERPETEAAAEKEAPKVKAPNAWHTKYRPTRLKDVAGQDAALRILDDLVQDRTSQAFLLTGPSGVGKTTLARIAGAELGASPDNILDFDAASNSGVDRMREITESANYMPFGDSTARVMVIDECHNLSKQAWDALLKATEEPPPHIFWFFCTTNPAKVPQTMKTRCSLIQLKALSEKELGSIYDYVAEEEKVDLPGDAADLIIRESNGSARQLLNHMVSCRYAKDKREVADLLKVVMDTDASLELCRMLVSRSGSWPKVMGLYAKLEDENPEGVRIMVMRYFGKVIKGAKSDAAALGVLPVLDAFAESYSGAEGEAPLLRSIARAFFAAAPE